MQGLYTVVYTAAQWLPRLLHERPSHSGYCSTVTPAPIPWKAFTQWFCSTVTLVHINARSLHSCYCSTVTPAPFTCKAFTQWLLQHSDSRAFYMQGLHTVVTAAQWLPRLFHERPFHSGLYCCTVTPAPFTCKAFTQWLLQHSDSRVSPCKAFTQWFMLQHSDSRVYSMQGLFTVVYTAAQWLLHRCGHNTEGHFKTWMHLWGKCPPLPPPPTHTHAHGIANSWWHCITSYNARQQLLSSSNGPVWIFLFLNLLGHVWLAVSSANLWLAVSVANLWLAVSAALRPICD
jgi:hypothetical protein